MWSSNDFFVNKNLFVSGFPLLSSHVSHAKAISCNSTGCVITCGFTSFGGIRSTLPNQVKLLCTVQWQSGTLVRENKHASPQLLPCLSLVIVWRLHSLEKWLMSYAHLHHLELNISITRLIVINGFDLPFLSIITVYTANLLLNLIYK